MTVRYPWPTFSAPLQCDLTEIRLDGRPLDRQLVDGEHLRLRLDRMPDWEQFDCDVTVTTDEPVPVGIDRLLGYAMVSSTPTNTRLCFGLSETDGRPVTGHLSVPHSTVAGSFTIRAETGMCLAGRRRVVGKSDPWTVVLDPGEAPIPPGAPPFDIAWIDFGSTEAPAGARENPTAHALMDLDSGPRLLLNSGIEGLQSLLYNRGAKLERRRVRDILSTAVARHAVATLFRAAALEVTAYDDGCPQPPGAALLRQICEAIADRLPGIGTVGELYERLGAAGDNRIADAELWTRIDLAIDELVGSTEALSTAAREVANG